MSAIIVGGRRSPGAVIVGELSCQQREVLTLAATGRTTFEVADTLGLTVDEVRANVGDAIHVLGARSKLEAVVIALRQDLIRPPNIAHDDRPSLPS